MEGVGDIAVAPPDAARAGILTLAVERLRWVDENVHDVKRPSAADVDFVTALRASDRARKADEAAVDVRLEAGIARKRYEDVKAAKDELRGDGAPLVDETPNEKEARERTEAAERSADEAEAEADRAEAEEKEAWDKSNGSDRAGTDTLCESHMTTCGDRCSAPESDNRLGGNLGRFANTRCAVGSAHASRTDQAATPPPSCRASPPRKR